jgi:hypothetical protein
LPITTPKAPGRSCRQIALHHVAPDRRDARVALGPDAGQLDAAHHAGRAQHRGAADKGRCPDHGRILLERGGERLPVLQRMRRMHQHVRHHREDARAQLAVEAVHHRQHHEQRHHAERKPQQRDRRHHRDEARAPPRTHVAQADEQGEGSKHRGI